MNTKILLGIIIVVYSLFVLSQILWGIPNSSHPFTYHMDEWHQLMAVRGVFTQGSGNIPGSAHGPLFHFFISGLFLGPFYVLGIIDPFSIQSSISQLEAQGRLFMVLRLNSLFFGVGSLIILWYLTKQYVKASPFITTAFFTLTPIWIILSSYFKYDIALIFWLLLTMFALLWYQKSSNKKIYFLAGSLTAFTLATKISALPLVLLYMLSYPLLTLKKQWKLKDFLLGVSIFLLTFFIVGIPDVFYQTAGYYEYFYSNLVTTPGLHTIISYGLPPHLYLLVKIYPLLFGHTFTFLAIISFLFVTFQLVMQIKKKKYKEAKIMVFFYAGFLLFVTSLIPLNVSASGNRSLVLLPFFAIFIGMTIQQLWNKTKRLGKIALGIVITLCLLAQLFEVYLWISIKWRHDPRSSSSQWIQNNIKQTTIGIENIPIYQYLPDVVLLEFYTLQQNPKAKTKFTYTVIDAKAKQLPPTIVLSNVGLETAYYKTSPKKDLLKRLQKEGYKHVKTFDIPKVYYQYFENNRELYTTGLIPLAPITIYRK